ncbi:MAG: MarR family transcriptional regulator [Phycisphaerae bacterium]|nr:MarR family transcriptional regulator [Phycisphaerae bacterium]HON92474.1 MarR family transcriptional regulator [Sedimentisphaerales bacterium]
MASGHEIAMGLRAAYWAMHRQTEASLAANGVTADQFVLLSLLAEQDGITQQELVRRASSDANTVRAMLVRLERRGLVTRQRHPTDGRALSVTLTCKGRQTHERLWQQSESVRAGLLAALGLQNSDALLEFLNRICEAMANGGGRPDRSWPAAPVTVADTWPNV